MDNRGAAIGGRAAGSVVGLAPTAPLSWYHPFSPESIVLRWTDDFAPRMLCGFEMLPEGTVGLPEVERRAAAGDLDAAELIVGGAVASTPEGRRLAELGAVVVPGVKAAGDEAKRRMAANLNGAAARG